MFFRKKKLLTMIEVLTSEVTTLKRRVLELEALKTREINLTIDGRKVAKNIADEIRVRAKESKEPALIANDSGIFVNGVIKVKGYKGEEK
ncbi:hypothetical protein ACQPUZ_16325 [Clostridium tertium]